MSDFSYSYEQHFKIEQQDDKWIVTEVRTFEVDTLTNAEEVINIERNNESFNDF